MSETMILNDPLFDGKKVIENASVIIENGRIAAVRETESADDRYFLMPCLIDAHAHISSMEQIGAMLKNGVAAVCDVSASQELVRASKQVQIISSAGMAMGMVLNPKGFVEKAAANGARYIKVLLFSAFSIGKPALSGIVRAAHEKGLKAAVHATEIATVRQAVECGADILLHVPLKEKFPEDLAETIAEKKIAVAPTLVMMETFANSGRNGYLPEHYQNAEKAVKLLHDFGVPILAATDANTGSFAPAVAYGTSMHREMELLVRAGMTPTEVLRSAASKAAEVFGIENHGMIEEGKKASLLLIEGRPDKNITDTTKIRQIWIDGEAIV